MENRKKVAFYTLGCKLNFSETSTIARNLQDEGFDRVDFEEVADMYVINTCSVTENADKQLETFMLFDRNLREGRFEGRSSLATYFIGIAKWHWLAQRRQRGRQTELMPDHYDGLVESPEAEVLQAEHRGWLEAALGRIGERCRELLRLYQLDYSMEEIAQTMRYANPDVAKKEAYRCRMRFRELLEQYPQWKDLLNLS